MSGKRAQCVGATVGVGAYTPLRAMCRIRYSVESDGLAQAPFEQPWRATDRGLLHLEHVNICIPSHEPAQRFYFDVLGLSPDDRRPNLGTGRGTLWANIGTTQIHLPEGGPEAVPGSIGLVYSDLTDLVARLERGGHDALEETAFAWKEDSDGTINVTCPYGNHFRIHRRIDAPAPESGGAIHESEPDRQIGPDQIEPTGPLDPRGGRLPSLPSRGLGIAYVYFRVRPGTAARIGRFYREVFGSEVQMIGRNECSAFGVEVADHERTGSTEEVGALVRVGPAQHLGFFEHEEALPEWDGHHICVYLSDEDFKRSFQEAERRGIVWVNPRPNYGKADTLEKATFENQFRMKDLVDPATGERLHVLEHEIRSVSHPSYPVGRDLSSPAKNQEL